jgi:hypothetical protein
VPPTSPTINYVQADQATLDSFNPLLIEKSAVAGELSKPCTFISRAMTFIYPLTGAFLFVMLVWAGLEMMGTAATKKSIDSGKTRALAALTGFLGLYLVPWAAQIAELIFKINICIGGKT